MKLLLILMLSSSVFASSFVDTFVNPLTQGTCVPAPTPKRKHKKRVPRKPVEPTVVIKEVPGPTVTITKEVVVEHTVTVQTPYLKNRLRLLGGQGPSTIDLTTTKQLVTMGYTYGAVFGLGFERMLTQTWSVEGMMLTNATWLIGIGYGF